MSLVVIHIQETLKYIKLNPKNSQSIYKHSTASNGYYECFSSFASQKVVIICNFDHNCNQIKTWLSKIHSYIQVAKISESRNIATKGSQIKQQYKSPKVEKKQSNQPVASLICIYFPVLVSSPNSLIPLQEASRSY